MGGTDPAGPAATSAQAAQQFAQWFTLHAQHDDVLLLDAPEVQQQLAVDQPAQPCDDGDRHGPAAAAAAAATAAAALSGAASPQDDSEGMALDDDLSSEPQTEDEPGYTSTGEEEVVSEKDEQEQGLVSEEEGEEEGVLTAVMDYSQNVPHYKGVCRHTVAGSLGLKAQVHVGHNIEGVGKSVYVGVYEASMEEAGNAARRCNEAWDFMSRGVSLDHPLSKSKRRLLRRLQWRNRTPISLYPEGYVPRVLPRVAGKAANSFRAFAISNDRRIHAVPADDPSMTGQAADGKAKYFDLTYCDCGPQGCNQLWPVIEAAAKGAKRCRRT